MVTKVTETVKVQTKYEITCDVCGYTIKSSQPYWWMNEYRNGEVCGEYKSPIDLCSKHQYAYSNMLQTVPFPFKYMKERYENFSEERKQEVVDKIKEIEKDLDYYD